MELNFSLRQLRDWMRANKLRLNPDETEVSYMEGVLGWVFQQKGGSGENNHFRVPADGY